MELEYIVNSLEDRPMFGETYDGSIVPSQGLDSDDDGIYIHNNRIYDNETRSLVMENNMEIDGHDPSVPIKRTTQEKVDSGTDRSRNYPDVYARRGNACGCGITDTSTKSGFRTGSNSAPKKPNSFLDMTLSIREIFEFIILVMIVVLMAMYFRRSSPTFVLLDSRNNGHPGFTQSDRQEEVSATAL